MSGAGSNPASPIRPVTGKLSRARRNMERRQGREPITIQCPGYRKPCGTTIPATKRSGLCYFCERTRRLAAK